MNSDEKRQTKRFSLREPVQYQLEETGPYSGAMARDISETGLKMRVNQFIPLGTELILHIQLSTQKTIDCMGRVVWVQKIPHMENYQAGVQLTDSDGQFSLRQVFPQYFV